MRRRKLEVAIISISLALIGGALIVLGFIASIDDADRAASIASAILALVASALALHQTRAARIASRLAAKEFEESRLHARATEEEFLAAWRDVERKLRSVTSAHESQQEEPMKAVLRRYEELPGVTDSDVEDVLLLLRTRNGILHPRMNLGAGLGSFSKSKAIVDAMNRQWKKLRTMDAKNSE